MQFSHALFLKQPIYPTINFEFTQHRKPKEIQMNYAIFVFLEENHKAAAQYAQDSSQVEKDNPASVMTSVKERPVDQTAQQSQHSPNSRNSGISILNVFIFTCFIF